MPAGEWIQAFRGRQRLIRKFRDRAAVSPRLARPLKDLQILDHRQRILLRRFSSRGIIKRIPLDDTWYLDEKMLLQYRMNRVKWAFILLFLLLGLIFLVLPRLK